MFLLFVESVAIGFDSTNKFVGFITSKRSVEALHFSVQIDEIRSLKSKFSTSALLSDRKIAIVNSAEAMTNQAANSFLKLLEEPRGNVLLILIAPFRSRVLPTIASRTLEIRFSSNSPSASGGRKENIPVKHIEAVRVLQAGMLCDKFALVKKYNLENKNEAYWKTLPATRCSNHK